MKTLKEAILADPEKGQTFWDTLEKRASESRYFQKFMQEKARHLTETEGTLQGDVTTETDVTNALGVVYNQIIMGLESHHPLDFARIFKTDKSQLVVPIGTYGEAVERAAGGTFSAGEKTTAYVTVDLDKEYGLDTSWTKAHLDDAVWDVLAEQNENAGYAVQHKLCERLVREIQNVQAAALAGGAYVTIANQSAITWAEFLSMLSTVDVAETGPADYVLVSPSKYWQLLALDEFVNSLYAGTDEVMRTGVAKTMMGVTVIRVSEIGIAANQVKYDGGSTADLIIGETLTGSVQGSSTSILMADSMISGTFGGTNKVGIVTAVPSAGAFENNQLLTGSTSSGTVLVNTTPGEWCDIVALNSKKALSLVYRRNIEIEPFQYPDENRYGFTTSVRAKADTLVPSAIAVGLCTAA